MRASARGLAAFVVAVAMAGVGGLACGGQPGAAPGAPGGTAAAAEVGASSPSTATPAVPGPAPTGPSAANPAGPGPTAPPPASAPAPGVENGTSAAPGVRSGDLPIEVAVAPACAALGGRLVAQVRTAPGTYVSLVVAYADGRNRGEMYAGPVNPDGTMSYPWVVPPTAAKGRGRVLVAGHDPAKEHSGTTDAFFLIQGASTC